MNYCEDEDQDESQEIHDLWSDGYDRGFKNGYEQALIDHGLSKEIEGH